MPVTFTKAQCRVLQQDRNWQTPQLGFCCSSTGKVNYSFADEEIPALVKRINAEGDINIFEFP